jgi:polyamine oxidase
MRLPIFSPFGSAWDLCVLCFLHTAFERLVTPVIFKAIPFNEAPFPAGLSISTSNATRNNDHQVLILGGGIAGVMAAESLHQQGIRNFKILEARNQLGGRMMSFKFGAPGRQYVLELGADWIHGTQSDGGPSNPVFDLACKHNLSTKANDYRGSISKYSLLIPVANAKAQRVPATFDPTGQVDYLQTFYNAVDAFIKLTVAAGASYSSVLDGMAKPTDLIFRKASASRSG